jgi:hypothetical protein
MEAYAGRTIALAGQRSALLGRASGELSGVDSEIHVLIKSRLISTKLSYLLGTKPMFSFK